MGIPSFSYQAEKLSAARYCLMLPLNEAKAIAAAFHECHLGLDRFSFGDLGDDNAASWVEIIKSAMNTVGIEDTTNEGTWVHRARSLTQDEKHDFARAVDELATWFDRRFFESAALKG